MAVFEEVPLNVGRTECYLFRQINKNSAFGICSFPGCNSPAVVNCLPSDLLEESALVRCLG